MRPAMRGNPGAMRTAPAYCRTMSRQPIRWSWRQRLLFVGGMLVFSGVLMHIFEMAMRGEWSISKLAWFAIVVTLTLMIVVRGIRAEQIRAVGPR